MESPTQHLTCLIIPVYNRRPITLACLERLKWCSCSSDWKIVLVDDGSTDGTGDEVSRLHPYVDIVRGDGNLYWTGAIVLGMQRAMELGASAMIWLNDDTFPEEADLRRLSTLIHDEPNLFVASTALIDGVQFPSCSYRFKKIKALKGQLLPADMVAGYQAAFSSKLVRDIGYPDARRWPHYAGDGSYSHQAHLAGYQVRLDGASFTRLAEFSPKPSPGEVFWQGNGTLWQRWQKTFLATNTRYRLATAWHLDHLTRGVMKGKILFIGRFLWSLLDIVKKSRRVDLGEVSQEENNK